VQVFHYQLCHYFSTCSVHTPSAEQHGLCEHRDLHHLSQNVGANILLHACFVIWICITLAMIAIDIILKEAQQKINTRINARRMWWQKPLYTK
jgi:hypothetical protein